MNVSAQVKTTDSTFINNLRPIVFVVNKIDISENDKDWINNYLIPKLEALGDRASSLGVLRRHQKVLLPTTCDLPGAERLPWMPC